MFDNAWVIGVLGGVISGLAVYFITTFFEKIKNRKQYINRVQLANNDLLRLLKKEVGYGIDNLSNQLISSMIESISLKYKVKTTDLYNIYDICQLIIYDIMDSPFVNSQSKRYYYEKLEDISEMWINGFTDINISKEVALQKRLNYLVLKQKIIAKKDESSIITNNTILLFIIALIVYIAYLFVKKLRLLISYSYSMIFYVIADIIFFIDLILFVIVIVFAMRRISLQLDINMMLRSLNENVKRRHPIAILVNKLKRKLK
ncbi:hypothetical protein [Eubacterium maltosivorans]|uniref:hypothetical protein n=1 Tax=Eubacterium maltosivorans TaxID=2041044 RepID=UPI0018A04DAD|nr:hypothetical protein [Eubacterium maltosivorans]